MENSKPKQSEICPLYTWGLGANGALGNQSTISEATPYRVPLKQKVIKVSSGSYCSVAITEDGKAYASGSNKNGRIGLGTNVDFVATFKQIPNLLNISSVSCGNWHTVALDNQGFVFSTGYNRHGELGHNDTLDRTKFVKIDTEIKFKKIAAGHRTTLIIDTNNQLYSCGDGDKNGHPGPKCIKIPTLITALSDEKIIDASVGSLHCGCINAEGEVFTWGNGMHYQLGHGEKFNLQTPKKIENFSPNAAQISCSKGEKYCHMGIVTADGRVYTWGAGYKGKLGHDNFVKGVPQDEKRPKMIEAVKDIEMEKIVCGGIHSTLLSKDGRVFTFGCGSDGRLGHPESVNYKLLYKEKFPREVEGGLKGMKVIDLSASYYHCICCCGDE